MKYETLYDEFAQLFPADAAKLKKIEKNAEADSSDGMHVMFGMVVVPFVLDLLAESDEEKLKKVFSYFEKMAESDNTKISEVLEFTVLEDFISRGNGILDNFKRFMGKKTIERCEKVEKYMM